MRISLSLRPSRRLRSNIAYIKSKRQAAQGRKVAHDYYNNVCLLSIRLGKNYNCTWGVLLSEAGSQEATQLSYQVSGWMDGRADGGTTRTFLSIHTNSLSKYYVFSLSLSTVTVMVFSDCETD